MHLRFLRGSVKIKECSLYLAALDDAHFLLSVNEAKIFQSSIQPGLIAYAFLNSYLQLMVYLTVYVYAFMNYRAIIYSY
jgi:hypothetical protein